MDLLDVPTPTIGPPASVLLWQWTGTATGVASTAVTGVVVGTVNERPGNAGYVKMLVVVVWGALEMKFNQNQVHFWELSEFLLDID